VDCTFSHPPGRTLPNQFHKGLSLSTRPSEAFQPAPHRTVVFNVPKKKGENTDSIKQNGDGDTKKGEDSNEEKEVEGVV
jgi:nuclear polyadenylated RNA-binding protein NAB2